MASYQVCKTFFYWDRLLDSRNWERNSKNAWIKLTAKISHLTVVAKTGFCSLAVQVFPVVWKFLLAFSQTSLVEDKVISNEWIKQNLIWFGTGCIFSLFVGVSISFRQNIENFQKNLVLLNIWILLLDTRHRN